MKILLMSVRAGYGHHSTAKAIMEKFSSHGHECEMLDVFEHINPILSDTIQDGYLISTKYLSAPYGKIYGKLAEREKPYRKTSIASILSELVSLKIRSYVEEMNPDLIIGTHSYAAFVMTILKEQIKCPMLGIVTDFTVHPFWESTDLDYYVIPDERLSYEMIQKGIAKEKLLSIGIPIKPQFESKMEKEDARRLLNIDNMPTVLLMMGSMGFGNIKKTLLEIDASPQHFQVMCICGSNARMKKAISKHEWKKNIMAYGFVDNIHEMMDAADVIITKPGGLTTSEAMAKGLPMITMNPIPGQEDRNLMFLLNNGAVIAVNDTYTMTDAINLLFAFPKRLDELQSCAKNLGKPNSTTDLYEFCEKNFFIT